MVESKAQTRGAIVLGRVHMVQLSMSWQHHLAVGSGDNCSNPGMSEPGRNPAVQPDRTLWDRSPTGRLENPAGFQLWVSASSVSCWLETLAPQTK